MKEKEETKRLWQMCFNDTNDFIELYFNMRYSSKVNNVWKEHGHIVAALQALPYPITIGGYTLQSRYMSGVCTSPYMRNKGIMRRLMKRVHNKLHNENVAVATLIPAEPWLYNYYESMGYAPVFRYSLSKVTPRETVDNDTIVNDVTSFDERIFNYFNREQRRHDMRVLHTADDFMIIVADIAIGDGICLTTERDGFICGLAIAYKRNNQVEIEELIAESATEKELLIYEIAKRYSGMPIMLRGESSNKSDAITIGMMRIISAETFLNAYAKINPELEMKILLNDNDIPENNGLYTIRHGECIRSSETSGYNLRSTDIGVLCEELMSAYNPYMHLMLN